MTDRSNGMMLEKRKRQNTCNNDEDHEDGYDTYFSEEKYRAMVTQIVCLVIAEGSNVVAEAEGVILEILRRCAYNLLYKVSEAKRVCIREANHDPPQKQIADQAGMTLENLQKLRFV